MSLELHLHFSVSLARNESWKKLSFSDNAWKTQITFQIFPASDRNQSYHKLEKQNLEES